MLSARRMLHNVGWWSLLRLAFVTLVIVAVALRTLVVEGVPWPLVGCVVAMLAARLLRERMIEHLERCLPALRWLGIAMLVAAGSSPLWFSRVEGDPTIAMPVFTGFAVAAMAYASSYVLIMADHRVERR